MNFQQKIWKGTGVIKKSLVPLILYIAVPGALMLFGIFLRRFKGNTDSFLLESGNFYQIAGTLLCLWILSRSARKRGTTLSEETALYTENLDRKLLALYLGLGFFSAVSVSAVITLVPLPDFLKQSYEESSSAVFQRTDLGLQVINLLIFAPAAEEIIFRGYMLSGLLSFFEEKKAVRICAGIFALCHVDLLWILYAYFLGVVLSETAIKKDNITYGIVLHGGFNFFSVVNLIIINTGLGDRLFYTSPAAVLCYGIIGMLCVLLIKRELENREEWYL